MQNERKRHLLKGAMAFSLVVLILSTPTLSLGWGPGGHMMVAQIAFGRLNPRAKAQANKLLLVSIDPVAITAKSKDFVNAAHWPDIPKQTGGFFQRRDLPPPQGPRCLRP